MCINNNDQATSIYLTTLDILNQCQNSKTNNASKFSELVVFSLERIFNCYYEPDKTKVSKRRYI